MHRPVGHLARKEPVMKRSSLKHSFLIFVLFIVFAFTGCHEGMERVELPPSAPVEGVHRIAVVGIENFTSDPALARQLEHMIAQTLRQSEAYEVVDATSSRATLSLLA